MVAGKVRVAMGLQKSPAASNSKSGTPPPPPNKPPIPSPSCAAGGKPSSNGKTVFSRSFGVYFPRSSAQVQPRPPDVADLLRLVEELRERESRLKTELLEFKLLKETAAIVPKLEGDIFAKNAEIEKAATRIEALEGENERLRAEAARFAAEKEESNVKVKAMENEIQELRKAALERERERESEELSASQRFQGLMELTMKSNLIKNLKKGVGVAKSAAAADGVSEENGNACKPEMPELTVKREETLNGDGAPSPRLSRCNSEEIAESTLSNIRSRCPRIPKPPPKPSPSSFPSASSPPPSSVAEQSASASVSAPPPPPPPPPRPLASSTATAKPAPPPPPPPPKGMRAGAAKVRRVPEVVEFYHSLMRRDSRKESGGSVADAGAATANPRDMIGEIENRSAYLLAIKTDVETQGEFIRFLIKEVESASFTDIEDVVPFVKWLDDELSYLVDERAVLKHFEWPEQKADALREAAFGYCDLKKVVTEAASFRDVARQPCNSALKKMQALFEKLEHGVYNLSRMRESATKRYKEFQIPIDWMLETGLVSQIKLASVKLAMKYMKRVSAELEAVDSPAEEEELIVQGVRFAFRVHQFAGGFDVETMRAFEELRDKARSLSREPSQQQRLVCGSSGRFC
ncbi:unnamed protein product [Linum trigynum]|uniref:Protein CHUP1, chloroplastic n=1 Tax=Linum trigynum TaxID=586398 RepID=A0AAV2EQV1_9ROSI